MVIPDSVIVSFISLLIGVICAFPLGIAFTLFLAIRKLRSHDCTYLNGSVVWVNRAKHRRLFSDLLLKKG